MFNVKDPQFGAVGNGQADDTAAIQKAVDMAKNTATSGGGTYRPAIYFPAGYYNISSPINITNTSGIWLMGDGGKWLGTIIYGSTSGPMFDFSGSSQSGCENFEFLSITQSGSVRSTIGVLFALTSVGGLNCGVRNCSFNLEDYATANEGFGSIGILNIRSEEFYVHECFIRANTPIILSNSVSLGATGTNFTAASRYQTLSAGVGSMGVTDITGTSLQVYERRQPSLVLNGVNSLNFQGYIGRASITNGSNETAILCSQYTTNVKFFATIESFSRLFAVTNSTIENIELHLVSANSVSPAIELVDLTGCIINGLNLKVSIPSASERNNRYVVYYGPNSGGSQPVNGFIKNSVITCFGVQNQYIISANLLKKATNVLLETDQPFEKRNGRIRQLANTKVQAGTVGTISTANILQFQHFNQAPTTKAYAGYYRIWIDGVIRVGNYFSPSTCTLSFQAQIILNQNLDGTYDPTSTTIITLDKSVSNPTYVDIAGLTINIGINNGIGIVTMTPRVMGSGTNEPINYDGFAEIQSDFLVNEPIPIA